MAEKEIHIREGDMTVQQFLDAYAHQEFDPNRPVIFHPRAENAKPVPTQLMFVLGICSALQAFGIDLSQ